MTVIAMVVAVSVVKTAKIPIVVAAATTSHAFEIVGRSRAATA